MYVCMYVSMYVYIYIYVKEGNTDIKNNSTTKVLRQQEVNSELKNNIKPIVDNRNNEQHNQRKIPRARVMLPIYNICIYTHLQGQTR